MRLSPPRHTLVVAAVLALAACQHTQRAPRTPRAPLAEAVDPGEPVLAAVQNARAALAAGDRLAAFNDVRVALANAVKLTGTDSALFPPQAAPPGYHPPAGGGAGGRGGRRGRGHRFARRGGAPPAPAPSNQAPPSQASPAARAAASPHGHRRGAASAARAGEQGQEVTGFDAQVALISVTAKLQTGDVAAADAQLRAIEAAATRRPPPASLPLIRADQSLTLASAAADSGRLGELRTHLEIARAALLTYRAGPHAADAKGLADAIGAALRQPGGVGALPPIALTLWSGNVSGWV